MGKSKIKSFNVAMRVTIEVNIELNANTAKEAIDIASAYKLDDIVEAYGDINDSEIHGITYVGSAEPFKQ